MTGYNIGTALSAERRQVLCHGKPESRGNLAVVVQVILAKGLNELDRHCFPLLGPAGSFFRRQLPKPLLSLFWRLEIFSRLAARRRKHGLHHFGPGIVRSVQIDNSVQALILNAHVKPFLQLVAILQHVAMMAVELLGLDRMVVLRPTKQFFRLRRHIGRIPPEGVRSDAQQRQVGEELGGNLRLKCSIAERVMFVVAVFRMEDRFLPRHPISSGRN